MSTENPSSGDSAFSGVEVEIILADAAQAADGKINMLGAGWSITGPAPGPSALAIWVKVPWHDANHEKHVLVELLNADGQPVLVPGDKGERLPLRFEKMLEAGRAPGLPEGCSLDIPGVIPLAPLPLEPGATYEWRVSVDGVTKPSWRKAFYVRKPPPGFQIAS